MKLDKCELERSLGLYWNIGNDAFTFGVSKNDKPITKRGLLAVINSVFDPLGFVAPVLLGGRIILRKALFKNTRWDDPLPQQQQDQWKIWQSS